MSRVKWLFYTAILGATPLLVRLFLAFLVSGGQSIPWVDVTDIIGFGLILAITNINLLEHRNGLEPAWKTRHIGLSLLLTVFLVVAFAATCLDGAGAKVDAFKLICIAAILTTCALIHNYAVSDRLEKSSLEQSS